MSALKGEEVRHVYVQAGYQGRGVGSSLLRAIEEEATSNGITSIIVNAVFSSEGFYSKNGFKRIRKGNMTIHGAVIESALMIKKI